METRGNRLKTPLDLTLIKLRHTPSILPSHPSPIRTIEEPIRLTITPNRAAVPDKIKQRLKPLSISSTTHPKIFPYQYHCSRSINTPGRHMRQFHNSKLWFLNVMRSIFPITSVPINSSRLLSLWSRMIEPPIPTDSDEQPSPEEFSELPDRNLPQQVSP